jgi:multimeric flavodoxin WrbA
MPDQTNILGDGNIQVKYGPEMENIYPFLTTLSGEKRVLFITTSNRGEYISSKGEKPKSTRLAEHLSDLLKEKGVDVVTMDAAKLKIHNCLGCVSELKGNMCGSPKAKLKDTEKNPHGHLKCWASVDFKDDELWKIANELYNSDAVIFFASNRWGNPNAIYQKLIERLDWIESSYTTYNGPNTVKNKKAGMVLLGQNWRVQESLEVQYHVLNFFGFETPDELFMGWQFTRDTDDEEQKSYQESSSSFEQSWGMEIPNKEETIKKEGGLVKESLDKGTPDRFNKVQVSDFNSFISKLNWK